MKRDGGLLAALDAEAESLLSASKDGSLETRISIFANVAKWLQVRNRISDPDDTSGLLDAYRRTINTAQSEVAEREAERVKTVNSPKRFLGRYQRAANNATRDNGGPQLDALKSRLPRADERGADGDRGGGGGAGVAIAGANRIVHPQLPGDAGTEFDERHHDDEF